MRPADAATSPDGRGVVHSCEGTKASTKCERTCRLAQDNSAQVHDLEGQQVGAVGDGATVGALGPGVALPEALALQPALERLLRLPAGVDEVTGLAAGGA